MIVAPYDGYQIVALGGESQSGSYLLRIRVNEDLEMPYGHFKSGKIIPTPAGEYVYVGSALAKKGGVSLGRRLVRHASRTGDRPPHAMRAVFLEWFPTIRLGAGDLRPKNGKHLHWNVDHLLDRPEAALRGAFIIRAETRLERELGQLVEREPCARIIAKGLGANDTPGNTHILRIDADEAWWSALPEKLERLLNAERP